MASRLNKQLISPISAQYIERNYHIVKQADRVLAFTCFSPDRKVCLGGTGWTVEMAKVLNKVLYVYDVGFDLWCRYNPHRDLFFPCDSTLPTLTKNTAIVGMRNIYEYPEALFALQETFHRSLV